MKIGIDGIIDNIAKDKFVKEKLCEVVDYTRDNYDLDIFAKI